MADLKPCPYCSARTRVTGTTMQVDSECVECGAVGCRFIPLASDEELRVLQTAVQDAYDEVGQYDLQFAACQSDEVHRLEVAFKVSAQRDAATLSALERRLRGVAD